MTTSRIVRIMIPIVLLVWLGADARAYWDREHQDIGASARANYVAYVAAHPRECVGAAAIASHWTDVSWGLLHEDDGTTAMWHFWNPAGGDDDGIYTFDSAYQRATTLWAEALEAYKTGDYQTAYRTLGRVAHLVGDMGVPAHANLDDHSDPPDWYEATYISPQTRVGSNSIATTSGLRSIMVTIAEISNDFDSGPVGGVGGVDGGVDQGNRRAGGFVNAEGVAIAQACYPAAIEGTGALFKMFYDTVRPVGSIHSPGEAEVHSGLKGVPLKSFFHSYGYSGQEADQIASVEYFYATKDDPTWPNDYTACGTVAARDAQFKFTVMWNNAINDDKVWVNCRATDNGGCESLTDVWATKEWCKIDSRRPQVINKKP